MSNGQGQQLGIASGGGVGAPTEQSASEQLLSHVRANNEQLVSCVSDLRSVLNRAIGEGPVGQPQAETAVAQAGVYGAIDEALKDQSRHLVDLRECIQVTEKIA